MSLLDYIFVDIIYREFYLVLFFLLSWEQFRAEEFIITTAEDLMQSGSVSIVKLLFAAEFQWDKVYDEINVVFQYMFRDQNLKHPFEFINAHAK